MRSAQADAPPGVVRLACSINANGTIAIASDNTIVVSKVGVGTYQVRWTSVKEIITGVATIISGWGVITAAVTQPNQIQVTTANAGGSALQDVPFNLIATGYPKT